MRRLLHLAAFAFLTTAPSHAQITNPDTLTSPPPRNPAQSPIHATQDLQWLAQYLHSKPALLADPRFPALLKTLTTPQAFWSTPGTPLADAAKAFLAGPGDLTSTDNRHLILTGCVTDIETQHCSSQRGLLFADTAGRDPLVAFAALRWNEQSRTTDEPCAPFTLWLFPSRSLDSHSLPQPLKTALANFTSASTPAPQITNVIIVDPTGIPHIIGTLEAGLVPLPCSTRTAPAFPRTTP